MQPEPGVNGEMQGGQSNEPVQQSPLEAGQPVSAGERGRVASQISLPDLIDVRREVSVHRSETV